MRKYLFVLLVQSFCFVCLSQTPVADSLKQVLAKEKNPLSQFQLTKRIADELITTGHPTFVLDYIHSMYGLAAKLKNDSLLMLSHTTMARHLDYKADSKEELEYVLKALAIAQEKYPSNLPHMYGSLASANNDLRNFGKAIRYAQEALIMIDKQGSGTPGKKMNLYWQLGYAYNSLNRPDSVLYYAQLGLEYYIKQPNTPNNATMIKLFSGLSANAYVQLGKHTVAEGFYQNSVDADTGSKSFSDAWSLNQYSSYLLKRNRISEAKYFARRGLEAAISAQSKSVLLQNVSTLRQIYEASHQPDSAYYFSKMELAYRDSLFNQERLDAVQDMMFREQVRRQEEATKKEAEEEQRKTNLQYSLIALALVSFALIFFIFSHSIIANKQLIRFLGAISLLIVFEFFNLLLHPWLGTITHHSPILMLLAMVFLAALLIPLHHRLEHWITHRLVEKNNKIRLAAAKKTIAQLESE
jgi:NADH:ubiquinone oxidoreductase subunit 3 (subunit A)